MSGQLENAKELLIVDLLGRGREEIGPRTIDDIEDPGKAELARIHAVATSGHAHDGAYQIVGRHGHQQFLFQHVVAFGVDVVEVYRAFEGTQIGFDIPPASVELNDLFDR